MALNVPSYPNPHDSKNPLAGAYAWIGEISLNVASGAGRLVVYVNPNAAAWADQPVDRVGVSLGQSLAPGGPAFPQLADLMADPVFASAYDTIGQKLYAHLLTHPAFPGATVTT